MARGKFLSYPKYVLLLSFFNIFGAGNPLELGCDNDQFECLNKKCIPGTHYCDNGNDCGDNSDEQYCNIPGVTCPTTYPLYKCKDSGRCIPDLWHCDGTKQCPLGDDEFECGSLNITSMAMARNKAVNWIISQAKNGTVTTKWGSQVHRTAVALYLARSHLFKMGSQIGRELAYELSIQFLWTLSSRSMYGIPTPELALFVNSFIVTCLNPRKFYGMNLVKELRLRVDMQNFTNPSVLLALCNAGEKITLRDLGKLMKTFRTPRREFWTDIQAYVIMALACATYQPKPDVDINKVKALTLDLKKQQLENGTVVNLKTTALVMQALLAAGEEENQSGFNARKAVEMILRHQKPDGAFGDIADTYYVLPVLRFASLINISSDHCIIPADDEEEGLNVLKHQVGVKWRVQYSLWIGDGREAERTLALRVLVNTSFYGIMESAGDIDSRFRFNYIMKNENPYIYSISGIQNDPEMETFWYMYLKEGHSMTRIEKSPVDFIPGNDTHVVMWYHSGF